MWRCVRILPVRFNLNFHAEANVPVLGMIALSHCTPARRTIPLSSLTRDSCNSYNESQQTSLPRSSSHLSSGMRSVMAGSTGTTHAPTFGNTLDCNQDDLDDYTCTLPSSGLTPATLEAAAVCPSSALISSTSTRIIVCLHSRPCTRED